MAYSAFSGLNSGNAGIKRTIRQTNSFEVGDVVRLDSGSYVKAQANSSVNAEIVGVVESRSESNFTVVFAGEVNLADADVKPTMGKVYFLSSSEAGKYTVDAPLSTGTIKKTVFIGAENNKAIIVNYLGLVNGYEGGDTVSLTGVSPVGQIIPFAGPISTPQQVPQGWLLCNGGEFSQLDYPELATLIGDTYGIRNGNLFQLPDLRGRSPLGVNQNNQAMDANETFQQRVLGTRDGQEFAELGNQHMPNHSHGASYLAFKDDAGEEDGEGRQSNSPTPGLFYGPNTTDESGQNTDNDGTYTQIGNQGPITGNDWQYWSFGADDHNYGLVRVPSDVEPSGGGEAHNNMQPFLVTNWLIRADSRVSASILTVNAQDLADVNKTDSDLSKSGGVLMWNAANDLVGNQNAKAGDNRFIVNPLSNSERNAFINGNFDIWQRGTSFSGSGTSGWNYTADRWFFSQAANAGVDGSLVRMDEIGSGNHPFLLGSGLSPITSVPGEHSLVYRNTSAKTSFAVNNYSCMGQIVEGYNYAPLWAAGTMTLSFWVYARFAGIYNVAFRNHSNDRSLVSEYTVNQPNTWEYKTITVTLDTANPTKWKFDDKVGLRVEWAVGKQGADYTTTNANTWEPYAYKGTPNAVNCLATASNLDPCLAITQCQLEPGKMATQFQTRRIQDELTKCERYYEKSYDMNTIPGVAAYDGAIHSNDWVVSNVAHINASFRTRKRVKPAVTIYNPSNGTANSVYMLHRESGTSANWNVGSVSRSETNIHRIVRSSGSWQSGYKNKLNFHYVSVAELGPEDGTVTNIT